MFKLYTTMHNFENSQLPIIQVCYGICLVVDMSRILVDGLGQVKVYFSNKIVMKGIEFRTLNYCIYYNFSINIYYFC